MRAFDKKKLYRLMCKENIGKGLIPLPSGGWGVGVDNAMKRDTKAGHSLGRNRRKTNKHEQRRAA